MKIKSQTILKAAQKTGYYLLLFLTSILGIVFFLSFHLGFEFKGDHVGFNIKVFVKEFENNFRQFADYQSIPFFEFTANPMLIDSFKHSYSILGVSLASVVIAGSIIAFIVMLSPFRVRKKIKAFLDLFEGLPDLTFIFILNTIHIFLYWKYDYKLFTMYGFGSNRPFTFPVIVLSILPAIIFAIFLLKSMEDEEDELYIHVGFSKGLSKLYIYSVHMIRNVLPVFMLKFRVILYMLLSNLVLVENMYFIKAYTTLIFFEILRGDHVLPLVYMLVLFIVPILLFEALIKLFIKVFVVRNRGDIQL